MSTLNLFQKVGLEIVRLFDFSAVKKQPKQTLIHMLIFNNINITWTIHLTRVIEACVEEKGCDKNETQCFLQNRSMYAMAYICIRTKFPHELKVSRILI